MTNKDKYKQAFSVLHTSADYSLEVEKMTKFKKKQRLNLAIAAAAACIVLVGGSVSAYAANLGGIQEKLSAWIHGSERTLDTTDHGDGSYTFTYEEDGTEQSFSGGGISIGIDGNETQMSADELINEMNELPEVDEDDNGTVWIYYYDQSVDITDMFDEDGICRVALSHDGEMIYIEVTRDDDGSYPYSCDTDISKRKQELYTVIE